MPPSATVAREAGRLAQQLISTSVGRGAALNRLRLLYPDFRWYCDDNYGLSVLCPARKSLTGAPPELPSQVKHTASHIIAVEHGEVVVVKDRNSLLDHETGRLRLFQVIAGLVPDGLMGEATKEQLRVWSGEAVVQRKSAWERLVDDED